MSSIDVEKLLAPVSDDAPSGGNLEYDPDYAAMELASTAKGEQQFGATVIPGEEPDWKEVETIALGLAERTKDLRIGATLARTALRTGGLEGFRNALALLKGYIDQYWDSVHPQLDPDDDNDPTIRVNTISGLADAGLFLKPLRDATLIKLPNLGAFAYRDWLIATGELPPLPDAPKPEQSTLEGAFAACEPPVLAELAKTAKETFDLSKGIEQAITLQVGAASGPNLSKLSDLLRGLAKFLRERSAAINPEEAAPAETAGEAAATGAAGGEAPKQRLTGEISSREDVLRAIDKIAEYYRRYEPSSPVPLFLNRAKRLASKNFLEILRDMTPDALTQALSLGGLTDIDELNPGRGD